MLRKSKIIVSVLLTLLLMVPTISAFAAVSVWETVGTAGFSAGQADYTSLAFNGDTPFVAYRDNSNGGKATVMKFSGTSWETVGTAGFSAGSVVDISLAFNGDTPYVAYSDGGNGNQATVMKFNGTSWEVVGTTRFSAGVVNYTSLALNAGTPYVAYQDVDNDLKATVMKFNGTNWETVGAAGFSAGHAASTSLAFNAGTPYVAYYDVDNDLKATVMKFNGTGWEVVGAAGFSAGFAYNTSLAFNGGTPYVAYQDGGNGGKATVMKFNGTSWEAVGTAGFSAGLAYNTSLAFNGATPYVAYQDGGNGGKATVMKFNGTIWETVGTAGFSAGLAYDTSIAFNGDTPYVAYRDFGNDNKATVMRLSTYNYGSITINGAAGGVYQIKQGSTVVRDDVTIPAGGSVTESGLLTGAYSVTEKTPAPGCLANGTPQDAVLTSDGQTVTLSFFGTYTVKYDANGGSGTMANQGFTYGAAQALTSNAYTRTGYTFAGWADSASGMVVYTDGQSVSNLTTTNGATVTLFAQWTAVPVLTSSVAGGKIYTGGRITLTPNITGGTWNWDTAFFSATFNSPATFTALKAGTSTITYTAEGQSVSYAVTITKAGLPDTGQDFTWGWVLGMLAVCALAAAGSAATLAGFGKRI